MKIGGGLVFLSRPFHVTGVCEGKKGNIGAFGLFTSLSLFLILHEGVQSGSIYMLARVSSAIISSDEIYIFFILYFLFFKIYQVNTKLKKIN